jgi:lipopolysaccharide/colanic/teichoic acid biosynthesis glycosyltransferase
MRAKRAFDLATCITGLFIIWPVLIVIAFAVKVDGGQAFFRQERVGLGGRRFRMWKFRTMVPNAERLGLQLTTDGDRRITRIGRWLRRTKLDELPQLFNVLAGEMSLVGPRPEVPRYTALYSVDQRRVLDLLPGITDPASITYRDEGRLLASAPDPERLYVECIIPEKFRLNLEYASRATIVTDIALVLLTINRTLPIPKRRDRPCAGQQDASFRSEPRRFGTQ